MKHLTAIVLSMVALSGCFYPEVDEGGFPRGVDGGVDAAVVDTGIDTGIDTSIWVPLPATVAWCASASYNLPCTCADDLISAFSICDIQVMAVRTNAARIAMASCIDSARDGAGCGNPYCEGVRSCYEQNDSALTVDDRAALANAYECIANQLPMLCPDAP